MYVITNSEGMFFSGEKIHPYGHWAYYLQSANLYSNRNQAETTAKEVGGRVDRHCDWREFDLNSRLYDHR